VKTKGYVGPAPQSRHCKPAGRANALPMSSSAEQSRTGADNEFVIARIEPGYEKLATLTCLRRYLLALIRAGVATT
jgi:hypothetical protein